ncbi:MAG: DUF4249 domain-containing protein [Bacteroidetes bacterium]|nr:DUF4249 domain-containing protein [Bacteroidota bacterium]
MKRSLVIFCLLVLQDSCVDVFEYETPEGNSILVVDGRITNTPGPYTIKLTRTQKLNELSTPLKVSAKSVSIIDNTGLSETLTETSDGVYQTNPLGIRGEIGKSYKVKIEMRDGKIYESIPEIISPAGVVDSVYYEFQTVQTEEGTSKYQFRIFMDSKGEQNTDNFYLWKVTGTYRVMTSPELHIILGAKPAEPPPPPKKDPRPCSGHIYDSRFDKLIAVKPCECCECWADLVDSKPHISESSFVVNNQYKRVDVGVIPVEFWPFWDKTMVKVEQMSLTKSAYNFWKIIRDQKDGASSLFQPPIGQATSNIFLTNGKATVYGYFQASAVSKKIIFLNANSIPIGAGIIPEPPSLPPRYIPTGGVIYEEFITDPFVIRESCLGAFAHSTTQKPTDWK